MRRSYSLTLLALLLITLAARLPLMLVCPGATFDIESYTKVVSQLLAGGSLYGNPALSYRYPYLPPWSMFLMAMHGLSQVTGLPQTFCFKLPMLAADMGIVALLYLLVGRTEAGLRLAPLERRSVWAALAYAASPLAILVSAAHGQFDSLPLLFLLLAYWQMGEAGSKSNRAWAAVWFGAAVAMKTWPLALLPVFLKPLGTLRARARFTAWAALVPLGVSLPWLLVSPRAIIATVAGYMGVRCISLNEAFHALGFLLRWPPDLAVKVHHAWDKVMAAGILGLALGYLFGPWELPLAEALAAGVLGLYVVAAGFSTQYLLWLLPLALLLPSRLALRHQAYALVIVLCFYNIFMPEVYLDGRFKPLGFLSPAMLACWMVMNVGLWVFFLVEWLRLVRGARRTSAL